MTQDNRRTGGDDARRQRERSHDDDPTRSTEGQIDDNQDDEGRDVNDPGDVGNAINRKAGGGR